MLGIALIILSAFFFTVTYAFYKAASPFFSNAQILCLANFCSWLFVLPFCRLPLSTPQFPMIVWRTLVGVATIYCVAWAIPKISLAETLVLNNSSPLFITLIAWIGYKTKISSFRLLGLLVGFLGVLIILHPSFQGIHLGLLVALLSGLFSALTILAMKKIAHEPFLRFLFYYFLLFFLIFIPFFFFGTTHWGSLPIKAWLLVIASAITMIVAQVTLAASLRLAASHVIAPFMYTGVVFGGVIDWIVWGDQLSLLSLIGMVIVCIGGILTLYRT